MLPIYTHDLDNNGAFVSHFTHSFRSNRSAFDQKKIALLLNLSLSPSFNLDDFISSLISIVAILFSILMIALRFIFFVLFHFFYFLCAKCSKRGMEYCVLFRVVCFALLCCFFFSLILHNLFRSVAFAPLAKSFA